jgi:hypothetical protein
MRVPVGKPMKLLADFQGVSDGRVVEFQIFKRGETKPLEKSTGVVKRGKGVGSWTPKFDENKEALPLQKQITEKVQEKKYYFKAIIDDQEKESEEITLGYPLIIRLLNKVEQPLKGIHFTITVSDGTTTQVVTDEKGEAQFRNMPMGKFKIELQECEFIS